MARVFGTAAEVAALARRLKEVNVADDDDHAGPRDMDYVGFAPPATAWTSVAIKVRTLTGREVVVDLDAADIVYAIKEHVARVEGIPPHQQRLIFGGRQLPDGATARECSLQPGSVVHLVLALRGGGGSDQ